MLNINKSLLRFKLPTLLVKVRVLSDVNKVWQEARPFEEIPRETMWHLFRNSLPGGKYYKLDMTNMLLAMNRENGDIYVVPPLMGRPQIVTTYNPDDFERVFRNEGIWPERPGSELLKYYREKHRGDFFQGVEGVVATQGKKWGDFRSKVNPVLMQPKNVNLYLSQMSQINKEFIQCIKKIRDPKTLEVPANFEDYINRWTLESVSVVALGKHLGLLKNEKSDPETSLLAKSISDFVEFTSDIELKASPWRWFATPKFKQLMIAFDNIQKVAASYVDEAIERISEEQKLGITETDDSVLGKLLKIDKKLATVMAIDLLMAGVDTTSSTFTAMMLCIAKNPKKQDKLREEVLRILPNKDSEFTIDSMKNVPYLRACIKESMRLYPLVVGSARVTHRDTVLSGYRVPKGTFVSMVSFSLLKNEKFFSRPDKFLPERWLRPEKDTEAAVNCPAHELKATNPFVYLPFGFGPRMCIGKRVVEMELELALARIIRNFQVDFNHSTENAFKPLLINVPNIPLQFKFIDIN